MASLVDFQPMIYTNMHRTRRYDTDMRGTVPELRPYYQKPLASNEGECHGKNDFELNLRGWRWWPLGISTL